MASNKKILKKLAEELQVPFAGDDKMLHGGYRGYTVAVEPHQTSSTRVMLLAFSVANELGPAPQEVWETMRAVLPKGGKISAKKYSVCLVIPVTSNVGKSVQLLKNIIDGMLAQFSTYGYYNCDARGVQGSTDVYQVEEGFAFLNAESAAMMQQSLDRHREDDYVVRENYVLGLLGAIGGGVFGALLIFFIARIGFVTSYAGVAMGAAVIGGYKWKGRKLSIISFLLCVAVSVAWIYLAFRIDMAMTIQASSLSYYYNASSFQNCFRNAKEIMERSGNLDTYYESLVKMMVFGMIGVLGFGFVEIQGQRKKYKMKKL